MDKQTHVKLILRHMEEVGPITSWQAINLYHCTRLPARIADIKKQGIPVWREMHYEDGKRWAVYGLGHS